MRLPCSRQADFWTGMMSGSRLPGVKALCRGSDLSIVSATGAILLGLALLVPLSQADQSGDWTYTTDGTNVAITGYTGPGGDVLIPDTILGQPVTSIGDYAFEGATNMNTVTIPEGVTMIGDQAFFQCTSLTNVAVPNSLASIGDYAFEVCSSLPGVTIPHGVISIGIDAFLLCDAMTSFSVDTSNPVYCDQDGILFNKDKTLLIKCPGGKAGDYTIPRGTTRVGPEGFGFCRNLTTITIPASITDIDDSAFNSCSGMTRITVPASVTNIGDNAFWYCIGLTNASFRGDTPAIGASCFSGAINSTIYYYPWTSGWTSTYGGRPTQIDPAYLAWLAANSLPTNNTADSIDSDNDSMLNWQEFLAHTDPHTNADRLAITSMGTESNLSQLNWLAKSNVAYQVMKSSNLLGAWMNSPSGMGPNQQGWQTAPMDQTLQYVDPTYSATTNTFYRVDVVP